MPQTQIVLRLHMKGVWMNVERNTRWLVLAPSQIAIDVATRRSSSISKSAWLACAKRPSSSALLVFHFDWRVACWVRTNSWTSTQRPHWHRTTPQRPAQCSITCLDVYRWSSLGQNGMWFVGEAFYLCMFIWVMIPDHVREIKRITYLTVDRAATDTHQQYSRQYSLQG